MPRDKFLLGRSSIDKSVVVRAIAKRYPDLTVEEQRKAEEFFLDHIAKWILQGKEIAGVTIDENGDAKLSIAFVHETIEKAINEIARSKRLGK